MVSRKYGGSGLSLAISRNLAHIMGGVLAAEAYLEKAVLLRRLLRLRSRQKNTLKILKLSWENVIMAESLLRIMP